MFKNRVKDDEIFVFALVNENRGFSSCVSGYLIFHV